MWFLLHFDHSSLANITVMVDVYQTEQCFQICSLGWVILWTIWSLVIVFISCLMPSFSSVFVQCIVFYILLSCPVLLLMGDSCPWAQQARGHKTAPPEIFHSLRIQKWIPGIIKFYEWDKSSLSQQTVAILVANLLRN